MPCGSCHAVWHGTALLPNGGPMPSPPSDDSGMELRAASYRESVGGGISAGISEQPPSNPDPARESIGAGDTASFLAAAPDGDEDVRL